MLSGSIRLFAHAGEAPFEAQPLTFRVRLYNNEGVPEEVLAAARKTSETVLHKVGLRTIWHNCTVGDPNRDDLNCDDHPTKIDLVLYLVARLDDHTTHVDRNALGYAIIPGHGEPATMAYVSYARVRNAVSAFRPEDLLALAMVHEIGHLLLGTNRHSRYGIMRAPWPRKYLELRYWEEFTFTGDQAKRVRIVCRNREGDIRALNSGGIRGLTIPREH
jgi:hypothetical protein